MAELVDAAECGLGEKSLTDAPGNTGLLIAVRACFVRVRIPPESTLRSITEFIQVDAFRCNEGLTHICGSGLCDLATLCGIFSCNDDAGESVEVEAPTEIDCPACLEVVAIATKFKSALRRATRNK